MSHHFVKHKIKNTDEFSSVRRYKFKIAKGGFFGIRLFSFLCSVSLDFSHSRIIIKTRGVLSCPHQESDQLNNSSK